MKLLKVNDSGGRNIIVSSKYEICDFFGLPRNTVIISVESEQPFPIVFVNLVINITTNYIFVLQRHGKYWINQNPNKDFPSAFSIKYMDALCDYGDIRCVNFVYFRHNNSRRKSLGYGYCSPFSKLHRNNGPAIIDRYGSKVRCDYYINGKIINKDKYFDRLNK